MGDAFWCALIWKRNRSDYIPNMTEDRSASSIKAALVDCAILDCAISCWPWVDHGYLGHVTTICYWKCSKVCQATCLSVSLSVRRSVYQNGYRNACESRVGSAHQLWLRKAYSPHLVCISLHIFTKTVGKLIWPVLCTLFVHGFYQAWSQVPASLRDFPPNSFPKRSLHRNSHWFQ